MARRAGSERVAQRGSGGALCVCLPLCFCFFLGLRRLLVSSTEKRRRKNTQRLLKKKERTFREPGALSLCCCCRCWSALWRGFADYRSCYRAAIVSQISELGYLTVQSKWSDEDQQSSSRAAAEQQHTTQTHFFVAPRQPRQPRQPPRCCRWCASGRVSAICDRGCCALATSLRESACDRLVDLRAPSPCTERRRVSSCDVTDTSTTACAGPRSTHAIYLLPLIRAPDSSWHRLFGSASSSSSISNQTENTQTHRDTHIHTARDAADSEPSPPRSRLFGLLVQPVLYHPRTSYDADPRADLVHRLIAHGATRTLGRSRSWRCTSWCASSRPRRPPRWSHSAASIATTSTATRAIHCFSDSSAGSGSSTSRCELLASASCPRSTCGTAILIDRSIDLSGASRGEPRRPTSRLRSVGR